MGGFAESFSKINCMHRRLVLWVQQSEAAFGGSAETFMAIGRSCSIDRIWSLIGIGFFLVLFWGLWEKALHSPFLHWSSASVHHSAGFASSQSPEYCDCMKEGKCYIAEFPSNTSSAVCFTLRSVFTTLERTKPWEVFGKSRQKCGILAVVTLLVRKQMQTWCIWKSELRVYSICSIAGPITEDHHCLSVTLDF